MVTILRTDQYAGVESFRQVGEFVPLQVDQQGKVIREVALACFGLPLPEHPGQELEVRVALIRDWRRLVPKASSSEEEGRPLRWDEKPDGTHEYWLDESWQATPLPVPPMEPKLIPIVTIATEADAVELVQTYTQRWPAQENAIRDWLIPPDIDINHGYAKTPLPTPKWRKNEKPCKNGWRMCNGGRLEPASACTTRVSCTENAVNRRKKTPMHSIVSLMIIKGRWSGKEWSTGF